MQLSYLALRLPFFIAFYEIIIAKIKKLDKILKFMKTLNKGQLNNKKNRLIHSTIAAN
jgi:hypothetical protein